MSLINDALRRASQTEKERPRRTATAIGMEPTPVARSSRPVILASVGLVVLLLTALTLAGWFFWQWWHARNNIGDAVVTATVAPPVAPRIVPPPPAPKPVPVAAAAPAPVAVVPATPVVVPPVTAPPALPNIASYSPTPWPVDLKLGGIFFNKANPEALINGNICKVGDDIQGVAVKKIEQDKVTVEWNGRTRVLFMGGQ